MCVVGRNLQTEKESKEGVDSDFSVENREKVATKILNICVYILDVVQAVNQIVIVLIKGEKKQKNNSETLAG